MSEYVVATASTADLDAEWMNQHHVPFVSYTFVIEDTSYKDDCTDATKQFILEQMKMDKMVSTTAVSVYEYMEFFESILAQGKDILFLDMTKSLSSSFNNSVFAKEELSEKYPERTIEIIDTNAVTSILGLLVKKAVQLHEEGKSLQEVAAWIEENKNNYNGRFLVTDLQWLRRGGRLSNASAIVGSLLSIKPLIAVDGEGKLVAYTKVRGHMKARKQLLEDIQKDMNDKTAEQEVAVIYSGEKEEGEMFLEEFKKSFPQIDNVQLYRLGPVIMGHIGPGFLAVVVYGNKRS